MKDNTTLFSLFGQFAHAQNYPTAFSEMLDLFLIPFMWHETEHGFLAALNRLQQHPKKDNLIALYSEIGERSEGFYDPLGELYEIEISKGKNGQFFTPYPICDLIAMMTGIESLQNGQSVYDPACGSGRMLLAAAKINRHLKFYGADIDEVCCKITVVNMLLNSMTGEVCHIDTLRNTFFGGYKLLTVLKDGFYHPYFKKFTDPLDSAIWLRPVEPLAACGNFDTVFNPTKSPLMSQGEQGNLFSQG